MGFHLQKSFPNEYCPVSDAEERAYDKMPEEVIFSSHSFQNSKGDVKNG